MNTKLIKATALATGAAVMAMTAALPGSASAQTYRYSQSGGQAYDQQGQYYYDGCERSETNRSVVGGLAGAAIGAAIGNNSGPARRNNDNALIGGVLGALAGAAIGNATAACSSSGSTYSYAAQPTYNYTQPSYNYDYGNSYNQRAYDQRAYEEQQRAYEAQRRAYDQRYAVQQPRCTYVESPVRMPDGRTQSRMVQVCQDSSGRYQVVQ